MKLNSERSNKLSELILSKNCSKNRSNKRVYFLINLESEFKS